MDGLLPRASARDLAIILFKRKWSIAAVMLFTMAAFLVWLFVIRDDMYMVTAKVLVRIGREQAPPPSVMGATPLVVAYRSQDVNSELDIFQSRESVAAVVDELHLDQRTPEPVPPGFFARAKYEIKEVMRRARDWYEEILIRAGLRPRLSPREKVIYGLSIGLHLKADKDSNVFAANLVLPYRFGSARVLNALLDRYLEYRQKIYRSRELTYFQSALDNTSSQLREAERKLQEFEQSGGIADLAKQESILLEHAASARSAWKEADYTRQEFASRIDRLEQELKKPDPEMAAIAEFGQDGFQQKIVNQLAELQRERERLRLTELDTGDRILNNRQQFNRLASMLAGNLRTTLAEKEQQTALRRTAYDSLERELRDLHDKQMRWIDLKRQARDSETTYLLFRKKFEESAADDAMQQLRIGNVAVIERAADPLAPAGMRKTTLLGLAVVACILAAFVWLTIAEFFDHGIYTVEALQREVEAPVLAAIPAGTRLLPAKPARSFTSRTSIIDGSPE